MPSLYHIGKGILSIQAFPGTMMALIGAGVIPMEADMVPMAPFWSKIAGVPLDANAFFLFVGCGKVASVLGMWFGGPMKKFFSFTAMLPPLCAAYMHHSFADGKTAPAAIFAVLAAALLVLPEPVAAKDKKN